MRNWHIHYSIGPQHADMTVEAPTLRRALDLAEAALLESGRTFDIDLIEEEE